MDFIKIRFGDDFNDFNSGFERTLEEMFQSMNPMFTLARRTWKPAMDIYETSKEIIILAEIAGVNKDDLELEINKKAVKIHGRRLELPRTENATYRLAEIQYGRFERILFLPAPIDTDKVSASYQNGFLKVSLSKITMDQPRKIPIADG